MTCAAPAVPAVTAAPDPASAGSIRSQILEAHDEWRYLFDGSLSVRPPTHAEQAGYEARRGDEFWASLYKMRDEIEDPISPEDATALLARCRVAWHACKPLSDEACHAVTSDAQMGQHRAAVMGPLNEWLTAAPVIPVRQAA